MSNCDDNALVQEVVAGDTEAFRPLVERHQGRIYYLGLKFFRRREDAEDFAQEVFVRAFERLGSFHGEVPFSAWLYRLAYNLAVNQYHASRRRLVEVSVEEPAAETTVTPETLYLKGESVHWLRGVLRELPEAYNAVVKMHYFDGLTYPQISRILEIPVNTIKSHIFRAKALIRRKLQLRRAG